MGAEKDFRRLFHRVRSAVGERVLHLDTEGTEGPGEVLALEQGSRIDDDDAEVDTLAMCVDQALLHGVALRKSQYHVSGFDLFRCEFGDHFISNGNSIPNEDVYALAEVFSSISFRGIGVDARDLDFEPTDGIAHAYGQRPVGDEVVDLGREVGSKVAGKGGARRSGVGGYDLDRNLERDWI